MYDVVSVWKKGAKQVWKQALHTIKMLGTNQEGILGSFFWSFWASNTKFPEYHEFYSNNFSQWVIDYKNATKHEAHM